MKLHQEAGETYILCRSRQRREKEKAIHRRFEQKIEQRLRKMESYCEKRNYRMETIAERIGRMKQKYRRAAGLYEINLEEKLGAGSASSGAKNSLRRTGRPSAMVVICSVAT